MSENGNILRNEIRDISRRLCEYRPHRTDAEIVLRSTCGYAPSVREYIVPRLLWRLKRMQPSPLRPYQTMRRHAD